MSHITDKLYNKKWGVFNHYLCHSDKWSETVENLNVNNIANMLSEVNAGYYFITLMQGRKYMAAPNAAFDRIADCKPGEACSKRDLPLDLYNAISPLGVDLYLYFTGDGPYKDEREGRKFGFIEPRGDGVTMPFVEKWASVLEEYAVRYGDKVNGWWIDGCYKDYFHYTEEMLQLYVNACKKGNPNAIVSLNDGVKAELVKDYSIEDFTCGEFNDFTYIPESRFVDGAQAHILAPLGMSPDGSPWGGWCKTGCKRDKEYMLDYVKKVNDAGGVVTIDIIIYPDGTYDPEQIEVLKYIGKNI